MFRRSVFILIVTAAASALPAAQSERDADVIAIERASLERWIKGDPGGFLSNYAADVSTSIRARNGASMDSRR